MSINKLKLGIVSCSGEHHPGGTISRLATRKVVEERPDKFMTICLPLYLIGGEEERKFVEENPTIAVDGCSKSCAKRAIEKFSGKIADIIDISELLGNDQAISGALSTSDLTELHREIINRVADHIMVIADNIAIKANNEI